MKVWEASPTKAGVNIERVDMDFLDRFKEPSSWASIAMVGVAFGLWDQATAEEFTQLVVAAIAGVGGLLGFFLKEGG